MPKKEELSDLTLPFEQGRLGPESGRAGDFLANATRDIIKGFMAMPEAARQSAGSLFYGGSYDPAPVVGMALTSMGATPFSASKGAISAGPPKFFGKPITPQMAADLEKLGVQKSIINMTDAEFDAFVKSIAEAPAHAEPVASKATSSIGFKPSYFGKEVDKMTSGEYHSYVKASPSEYSAYLDSVYPLPPKSSKPSPIRRARVGEVSFQPFDWRRETSPYATEFSRSIPQEAVEAGFNPNFPLYKGRGSEKPTYDPVLPDPANKDYERALFFAEHPEIAGKYGRTTQYVSRAENPAQIDWETVARSHHYEEDAMSKIIEAARKEGIDLLKVKGMRDVGSDVQRLQNQFLITQPPIVRLPHAVFDPRRLSESNLLGGLAGGVGLGALGLGEYNPREP